MNKQLISDGIEIPSFSTQIDKDIILGVFGYSHSSNIGDYMQTIAQLNILSYFYRPEWNIESHILRNTLEYLSLNKNFCNHHHLFKLQPKNIKLIWIDRDLLSLYKCDQPIWIIMNGWFMHKFNLLSSNEIKWPPAECFKPLFVSFHCQNLDMLDNNGIAYLQKYSPIGCRDYSTVKILRNYNIPAFYTGCLTATLEQPELVTHRENEYCIDIAPNNLSHIYKNNNFTYIEDQFDHYLEKTISIFKNYNSAKYVKTSRLHAYIPCKMLGVPNVELDVKNKNIGRFDGLIDSFKNNEYIFNSLLLKNRLLGALSKLLNSNYEETVVFKNLSQYDHSYISTYHEEPYIIDENTNYQELYTKNPQTISCDYTSKKIYDIADCIDIKQNTNNIKYYVRNFLLKPFENTLNIVICFDESYLKIVPTMLKSLCLSNPHLLLQIHCLTKNISDQDMDQIKNQLRFFNNIVLKKYDIKYEFKNYNSHLTHVTSTTMNRLLISDLITDKNINRIIYLDVDLLVIDKLDELINIDTGEMGIAARNSAKNVIKKWIKKQPNFTENMENLYNFDDGFNAGVLVMDLYTLREKNFASITRSYYTKYGFNDQIILNLYCQNKHSIIPDKYNTYISGWLELPSCEENYSILHFTGSRKPWNYDFKSYTDKWKYYESNLWIKYNMDYKFIYASSNNILDNKLSITNKPSNPFYVFVAHQAVLEQSIERISNMMENIGDEYVIAYGGNETLYNKDQHLLCVKADDSYAGLPEKINKIFTFIKENQEFNKYSHFIKLDYTVIIKKSIKNLHNIDYAGFVGSQNNMQLNRKYHINKCPSSIWNNKEYSGRSVPYCWGGYGYILSKRVIDKVFPNDEYKNHIYEDLYIGLCLYDAGVSPININITDFFFDDGHVQKNKNPLTILDQQPNITKYQQNLNCIWSKGKILCIPLPVIPKKGLSRLISNIPTPTSTPTPTPTKITIN